MKRVRAALQRVARDLRDVHPRFALIGGFAVSARSAPRTTRDVDFVVAVRDDAEAERVVFDLQNRGYVIMTAIEQAATGRFATARLRAPGSDVLVDLLFASSGIEDEVASRSEEIEILKGVRVPVARVPELIALKVLARDDRRRPQDAQDLRALLAEATPGDIHEARAALHLVSARGYARGKDLELELDRAIGELSQIE